MQSKAVKIQSKYSQNAVKMQSKCSQNAAKIQLKCSQNAVKNAAKMQLKFSQTSVIPCIGIFESFTQKKKEMERGLNGAMASSFFINGNAAK